MTDDMPATTPVKDTIPRSPIQRFADAPSAIASQAASAMRASRSSRRSCATNASTAQARWVQFTPNLDPDFKNDPSYAIVPR